MYKFCVFVYMQMKESKSKNSMYNMHLNFLSFFSGKKCAIHTWVNMVPFYCSSKVAKM